MLATRYSPTRIPANSHGGFTIIEMVTVFAIMTIILAITLATDRGSQSALKQINATYEVALLLREAQIEGTSVVEQAGGFNHAVGVYLTEGSGTLTKFLDMNDNLLYDSGEGIGTSKVLRDNAVVGDVCAGSVASPCSNQSAANLSISFRRPHPDAHINLGATSEDAAQITVTLDGISRTIVVYSTGLIQVE